MTTEYESHETVRRMVQQAQDHARSATAMVEELEALRVTGTHDGTHVVLGQTGALLEISLSDRLDNAGLREIETAVARANADAQYRLQRAVTDLANTHYGEDSETTRTMTSQYDRLLPNARPAEDEDEG